MFIQSALVYLQIVLLSKAKNVDKRLLSTAILLLFRFHVFGFCTCENNKQVPGYKETEPDVQFSNNYPDNWASIPALVTIFVYVIDHSWALYANYYAVTSQGFKGHKAKNAGDITALVMVKPLP